MGSLFDSGSSALRALGARGILGVGLRFCMGVWGAGSMAFQLRFAEISTAVSACIHGHLSELVKNL